MTQNQKAAMQVSKTILLGGIAVFVIVGIVVIAFLYNPNNKDQENQNMPEGSSNVENSASSTGTGEVVASSKNASTSLLNSNLSINTNNNNVNAISDGKILEAMNRDYSQSPHLIMQKITDGKFNNQANAGKSGSYRAAIVWARGDVNNDGLPDAILESSLCEPTCSYGLDLVLNNKNGRLEYIMLNTAFYAGYGARTKIKSISIDRNIITIVGQDFLDVETWGTDITKRVKLDGNNLVEVK